ncbi:MULTISPECIES: GH92 family glycosyl hydrolase [unclassified Granulicatella]|uniref:GH92 family glycosyl hydrolase n=1 Tax=unclassified Granulicatella TaxID=2630493 RepID=UPI001073B8AE|nr:MULTISPECIES: GH92 family glycosyl hydrolase [unclassified Granulicatella]MBF0779768.1 GH92 family glycosyl hydrolase [Granulicatella sp. 19428wC4_WM01]TFU96170.1 alpha-mannosidase [Granulicatella sp. WM01]
MTVSTIDTRYGTYNSHSFSNGNTLPLTGVPFGMNYFTLQTTDTNGSWFFNPHESTYQGIRLTHQPSPWLSDFSQFLITPVTGTLQRDSLFHRQSSYQVDQAVFRPDQLSIFSNRFRTQTTLVPSMYGANIHMTSQHLNSGFVFFAPDKSSYRQLDDYHIAVTLYNASQTQMENFAMYIVLQFNHPITKFSQLVEDTHLSKAHFEGNNIHIRVDFDTQDVEVKLATSFISHAQAIVNLNHINDFQTQQTLATQTWNSLLQRIHVHDKETDAKKMFYHCLYRCLLFPQTFYEITEDKKEIHLDTKSGTVKPGKFFTNNGYWDTFRTTYPLFSLIYPDYYEQFLEGILTHYHDTGFLPKWLSPDERGIMPGTLVDGVLADACAKHIRPDLMPELLQAMVHTSTTEYPNGLYGRHGSKTYQELGYLPLDYNESVSHSLDYAYSDWCIAQVAKSLHQTDIYQRYATSSLSYRQLFDKETGFIRAKNRNGQFRETFSKYAWGKDYAECSAIQATLSVFHDIDGLRELLGGANELTRYLVNLCQEKRLFEVQNYGYEIHEMSEFSQTPFGQLAISNQPSFHIPYLFNWSTRKDYTTLLIKQLLTHTFSPDFKGYPGDEDNGSLSAWYIFSSLGFYPVCPGKATYQLGIPQFDKVTLYFPHVKKPLVIKSENNYEHYQFVQQTLLDNTVVHELSHEELLHAKELTFTLSLLPNHN